MSECRVWFLIVLISTLTAFFGLVDGKKGKHSKVITDAFSQKMEDMFDGRSVKIISPPRIQTHTTEGKSNSQASGSKSVRIEHKHEISSNEEYDTDDDDDDEDVEVKKDEKYSKKAGHKSRRRRHSIRKDTVARMNSAPDPAVGIRSSGPEVFSSNRPNNGSTRNGSNFSADPQTGTNLPPATSSMLPKHAPTAAKEGRAQANGGLRLESAVATNQHLCVRSWAACRALLL